MLRQSRFSGNQYWTDILYQVPNTAKIKVAVLGAENGYWNDDVRTKILNTGLFDIVDVINLGTTTPNLSELKQYSAVLVYTDNGIINNNTFGDNLADYVDAGYGVVTSVFTNVISGNILGRWNTGGYDALTLTDFSGAGFLTLKTPFAPSPILEGVTNFNGGVSSYHGHGSLTSNTTLIASWSDDTPLVIEKSGFNGKIVALNFFPPSSSVRSDLWVANTDGGLIMANALNYVKKN